MKTKTYLSVLLGIVSIALLSYGFYYTMKNRPTLETNDKGKSIIIQPSKENSTPDSDSPLEDSIEQKEEDTESSREMPEAEEEKDAFIEITTESCDDECESFSNEEENLKYCRQVCGLDKPSASDGDCNSLKKLEKDYCWKDLAIKQENIDLCENISDSKIKETCQNRIAEEVLEKTSTSLE